jgi:DNA replication protein DnaC
MEIVEERYGRGSTMITSKLPIKTWHDVIGEPTFADAILDRGRPTLAQRRIQGSARVIGPNGRQ